MSRSAAALPLVLVPAMALAFLAGCDGIQRGQYSSGGHEGYSIAGMPGSLEILHGSPLGPGGSVLGDDRPLLYFLFLAPGSRSDHRSDGMTKASFGMRKSTFATSWGNELVWDRERDVVFIDDVRYDRAKGNAFVVLVQAGGVTVSRQLASIDGTTDASEVLEAIKSRWQDNAPLQSIQLEIERLGRR